MSSADSLYRVGIAFDVEDLDARLGSSLARVPQNALARPLSSVKASLSDIGSTVTAIGGRLSDAFTGAVERVGELVERFGMLGAVAGVGAIGYGVTHLNSELEKTKIAFADILTANGVTANLTEGLSVGAELMTKIRKDAAALPGETQDLALIFKMASIPGLRAGASVGQLEHLSSVAMAYGMGTGGMDSGTVARELAMLLNGRAGAHNTLGLLVGLQGDSAKQFNEMSDDKRFDALQKAFDKHKDSIELYANSFEGLASTVRDSAKLVLANATAPLFDHVKGTLASINTWFEHNQGLVDDFTGRLGQRLAHAWDMGVDAIERWWPAISRFASDAYDAIAGIWERVEPTIAAVGESIRESLGDGSALKALENVLRLYGAAKIGSGLMPMLGGAIKGGSGLLDMLGGAGGGEALGALGGVGEALGGIAVTGPAAIAVIGAAGLALGGIAGAFDILTDSTNSLHEGAMQDLNDTLKSVSVSVSLFTDALSPLRPVLDDMGAALLDVVKVGSTLIAMKLADFDDMMHPFGKAPERTMQSFERINMEPFGPPTPSASDKQLDALRSALKGKGGPGSVHIDRVEIAVSGNQEPNRIARVVTQKLAEMTRFRTSSPDVPNYTAGRRGG